MVDILNLALPYFGLIFIGFACGKTRGLPESGLAWMNFFLLYVSLPALLFRIMSETPFSELNNPPFLIATTLATICAFVLAMVSGRIIGDLSLRKATMAGLAGAYGNIGYMGPGLALAVLGSKAAAPTALIFCCDSIFLFSIVPLLMALTDREHPSFLHAIGLAARQIVLNPLIMSAVLGALVAAFHIQLPTALDRTLLFLQNAAAPTALFVLGVTVALRPFDRVPWEVPGVIAIKLLIHPLIVFGLMLLFGPFAQPWAATAVLMAALPPALNVFVMARQNNTWIEPASVAVLIGTFASVVTLTSVMWFIQSGRLVLCNRGTGARKQKY
jgi:predicted permease